MKKRKLTKEERSRYDSVLRQMKYYAKRGVEITLVGREASAEEIASACAVKEPQAYMGDYIWNEEGELEEIRYDRILKEHSSGNQNS